MEIAMYGAAIYGRQRRPCLAAARP